MTSDASIGILGGGVAGLSLAHFLREPSITILEKSDQVGGLARSYDANGVAYDIGPHIMFSKNQAVLDFMNSLCETEQHKRSAQVFLHGSFVKYPFENFLGQLKDQTLIDYCLNTFLHNPYADLPADNMLAFFLKTFGEGITRTYLQPYNEKIWKFDPSMMDTQMVDRIPKPPPEHIIESAKGKYSEGYTHQLYFTYPKRGGFQSLVDGLARLVEKKGVTIATGANIKKISKSGHGWAVTTPKKTWQFSRLVNCMPIHELMPLLPGVPTEIQASVRQLRYNSIYIIIVNVAGDTIGDNFSITIPDPEVLFHRASKLDFMGGVYHKENSSTLLLEVTFRDGDIVSQMTEDELVKRCVADVVKIKFIANRAAVNFTAVHKEKYAYVMYDLTHRANTNRVLGYLKEQGIESCGRFAEFVYVNSDQVIARAMALAERMN